MNYCNVGLYSLALLPLDVIFRVVYLGMTQFLKLLQERV